MKIGKNQNFKDIVGKYQDKIKKDSSYLYEQNWTPNKALQKNNENITFNR